MPFQLYSANDLHKKTFSLENFYKKNQPFPIGSFNLKFISTSATAGKQSAAGKCTR